MYDDAAGSSCISFPFDFEVFRVNYKGKDIEFKAKVTEGLIVYLMKLL